MGTIHHMGLAMWVIAVTTYQPLIKTMLPLSYCSQTIVKLKPYLYFSTSHAFIFICIPLHSATTRDLDSSTKEVHVGQEGPANLLYGKGLIRQGHLKLLPSHGPHRIWESFTHSWEHMRQGERMGKRSLQIGQEERSWPRLRKRYELIQHVYKLDPFCIFTRNHLGFPGYQTVHFRQF